MFSRKKTYFPGVDGGKFNVFQIFFGIGGLVKILRMLQNRQKWLYLRRNLAAGDVVLVAEENTSKNSRPLVRMEQVFPDNKGFVHRVKVNVKSAILEHPVDRLVLLVEGKLFE